VAGTDWAAALADPAALRDHELFLAEGRLVLQRLLAGAAGGPSSIVEALATPAAANALALDRQLPGRVVVRTPAEMEAMTGFNFHRGVLALVKRHAPADPRQLIADVVARGRRPARDTQVPQDQGSRARGPWPKAPPIFVVAEHLVDVDNVGSCFRNARAFGAAALLLDVRCPDPLYRKAVRTSLGAVLEVPWAQASIRDLLDALADAGVATVGLTPDGDTPATLAEVGARLDIDIPTALVVGNEGHGLSDDTRARCAYLARIPLAGGADSLNVATALAVGLYEWQVRRT
jgi:tRNA G18 (ribose-2'-O)-methylase SpoU